MPTVSISHEFPFDAAALWDAFRWENGSFFLGSGFFAKIEFKEVPDQRGLPPSTRTLHLIDGPAVEETMVALDETAMRVDYELDQPEQMGLRRYAGRYYVDMLAPGRSRVTIEAIYTPGDVSPADFEPLWKENEMLLFAHLQRVLGDHD